MKDLYIESLIKDGKPYYHEIINKTLVSAAKQKLFKENGYDQIVYTFTYEDFLDANYYTWIVKIFELNTTNRFSGKILDTSLCLTKDLDAVVKKCNSKFEFPVIKGDNLLYMYQEIQTHLEKATRAGVIDDYYRRMAYLDMSYRWLGLIGTEGGTASVLHLETLYDVYDDKEEKK